MDKVNSRFLVGCIMLSIWPIGTLINSIYCFNDLTFLIFLNFIHTKLFRWTPPMRGYGLINRDQLLLRWVFLALILQYSCLLEVKACKRVTTHELLQLVGRFMEVLILTTVQRHCMMLSFPSSNNFAKLKMCYWAHFS